jgi:hypothetical protein
VARVQWRRGLGVVCAVVLLVVGVVSTGGGGGVVEGEVVLGELAVFAAFGVGD